VSLRTTSACRGQPPASAPARSRSSFEQNLDDYNAIMVKALADRLAERSPHTCTPKRARTGGYGAQEQLSIEDLVAEKYRGIRPAYGYPACPDHSEKFKLFDLLNARRVGLNLTESGAMTPAASVSGLYFSHPEAKYFNVGRIGRDQLEDYARRKGEALEVTERWLALQLAYEPAEFSVKC
jgi:5-methyltetrahydrofolate--homocysteine methyltransferase